MKRKAKIDKGPVPRQYSRGRVMHIENMDPALIRSFRAWCALRDITMRDKIMSLMRETIRGSET